MKESEFRKELGENRGIPPNGATVEMAVILAKQAGARFDPEGPLPFLPADMEWAGHCLMRVGALSGNLVSLDDRHKDEVLRRCKAVEEAVAMLREHPSTEIDPLDAKLLAILEGTK